MWVDDEAVSLSRVVTVILAKFPDDHASGYSVLHTARDLVAAHQSSAGTQDDLLARCQRLPVEFVGPGRPVLVEGCFIFVPGVDLVRWPIDAGDFPEAVSRRVSEAAPHRALQTGGAGKRRQRINALVVSRMTR